MYVVAFIVLSIVIFALLMQINLILGLVFFILAIVALPAIVIQRREAPFEMPLESDAEHHGMGVLRLARIVGLDTTGIAIAVLLIILAALLAKSLAH